MLLAPLLRFLCFNVGDVAYGIDVINVADVIDVAGVGMEWMRGGGGFYEAVPESRAFRDW